MHTLKTLPNGLRVILVPLKDAQSVTVMKGYNVGSRQESDEISGAAHFIEHLMFKGTPRRPVARDISKEMDRIGAIFNAFTSKEMTAYYVKAAAEHFELALDMVSDMTYNALFDADEMDTERGVVIEEIRMYEDNPQRYVGNIYEREAFAGGNLGRDILGTVDTITNISREQLVAYRDSFYSDDNAVLVVSGAIPENIDELLAKYCIKPSAREDHYSHAASEYSLATVTGPKATIYNKKIEQVHLMLGFLTEGEEHIDSAVEEIIATHLGSGMSSILFDEVREKRGLCYYIRMNADKYSDIGSLVVQAGLNKNKLAEAIPLILSLIKKVRDDGFTDIELQETKDQIIGSLKLSLEDTADLAQQYLYPYVVTGELRSPQERIDEITAVSKDAILRVAQRVFVNKNLRLGIIHDSLTQEEVAPLLHID